MDHPLQPAPDPERPDLAVHLGRLPRLHAPVELDQRVVLECSTAAPVSALLTRLTVHRAPQVLDRLLMEELAWRGAQAERFVRSLPRIHAPSATEAFIPERVRSVVRRTSWQRGGALVSLAAAFVLIATLGMRLMDPGSRKDRQQGDGEALARLGEPDFPRPTLRFQRELVAPSALDPFARSFFEAFDQGRSRLGGGR